MSYHYLFKVILIGDAGVGKTCVLNKFVTNKFQEYYDLTIGVEFATKHIDSNNKIIKLQCWDTAGQESFRSITRAYFRNSAIVLLMFDLTNKQSFNNLYNWLDEVMNIDNNNHVIILIGTKQDKVESRQVRQEDIDEFVQVNGLQCYIETSAKTNKNIQICFTIAVEHVLAKIANGDIDLLLNESVKTGLFLTGQINKNKKESKQSNACKCS